MQLGDDQFPVPGLRVYHRRVGSHDRAPSRAMKNARPVALSKVAVLTLTPTLGYLPEVSSSLHPFAHHSLAAAILHGRSTGDAY